MHTAQEWGYPRHMFLAYEAASLFKQEDTSSITARSIRAELNFCQLTSLYGDSCKTVKQRNSNFLSPLSLQPHGVNS